jgi:hypothetical protein
MGDATPINEQPGKARRFRFRLRGLFLCMLLVAAACYALRGAYYWHVKNAKSVLSEYEELENIRIDGIEGRFFFEVEKASFSIAGKPDATVTISIPYAAPKSRIRSIVDDALASRQKL